MDYQIFRKHEIKYFMLFKALYIYAASCGTASQSEDKDKLYRLLEKLLKEHPKFCQQLNLQDVVNIVGYYNHNAWLNAPEGKKPLGFQIFAEDNILEIQLSLFSKQKSSDLAIVVKFDFQEGVIKVTNQIAISHPKDLELDEDFFLHIHKHLSGGPRLVLGLGYSPDTILDRTWTDYNNDEVKIIKHQDFFGRFIQDEPNATIH